ncbi:MAG: hypothetical protein KJS90_01375 [Acidobacteria bacterium]|nr:hypothetical protein [Acidobacteriota bacterium]
MATSKKLREQQSGKSVVDLFLPEGELPLTDPYDDVAAQQWATAMTVLGHVAEGATIDMGIDAVVGAGNQNRKDVTHAVKRTLRELLAEIA